MCLCQWKLRELVSESLMLFIEKGATFNIWCLGVSACISGDIHVLLLSGMCCYVVWVGVHAWCFWVDV